ncbi:terminase [Rhodococcus sp. ACS1]|uniref:terminase n=1 Tax=Rhodococcus sp. ACS1 TaxID=2028570 RepID=UPI000BB14FFE|nr:terminase [Rhodococcus sp. ACS1]PBC38480.1 terminase [Rhodococcus sp. ACS1]
MPHDIVTLPEHDRECSLGWLAIAWLEYFAIHGPGDVAGDPVAPIIDEYCGFLLDTYALQQSEDPKLDGRRLYDHVFLSRPKGCAKSEIAALIGIFEGLGPCRFDGWAEGGEVFRDEWGLGFEYTYAPGEPMGKRLKNPFIRCVATEEGQAGLIYDTIHLNLTEGKLAGAMASKTSAGLTKIAIPGGGEIVPSTASAASKDGGKDTLVLFDETHLYNTPQLRQTYKTLTRNLVKRRKSAQTFAVETTTMFQPGEESIAEQTYQMIKDIRAGKYKRQPRQLFDHRYGEITPAELEDEDKLRAALIESYGDCWWNDIEGLIEEISNPRNDITASFRYWFNSPTSAENAWIAEYEWARCAPQEGEEYRPIREGDVITLGFDGSRQRRKGTTDATALVGCRVSDGMIFEIKIWEQPVDWKGDEGYKMPVAEIDRTVKATFNKYKVVGFYADPAKWETFVAAWEAKFAEKLKVKATQAHPIEWWMTGQRNLKVVEALREFQDAVLDREIKHNGEESPILWNHVINARRKVTTSGIQIAKENPDSPHKIDGAVAAMLAWTARVDAVAKGLAQRKKKRYAQRIR